MIYLQPNKKRREPREGDATMFIISRIKKARAKGKTLHAKTMMSRKANEALKVTPNMCRLGRTQRKKNEGRG